MVKVSYDELVEILGDECSSAIDTLFEVNGWGDEVLLKDFLPEWTEMVEFGTKMIMEFERTA